MAQMDIVLGIAIVSSIFIYSSFKLNEIKDEKNHPKHTILQLILFVFGIYLLMLIPPMYNNFNETCSPVIANSTSIGSTTTYEYSEFCTTKTTNVPSTFMKVVNKWAYYIVLLYIALYFAWIVIFYPWLIKYRARFGK